MDIGIAEHLTAWADREFTDDVEREQVVDMLIKLWKSDADYFASKCHSWWELLDIARRVYA